MNSEISPTDREKLQKLAELLDFGAKIVTCYKFDKNLKSRKLILLEMMTAVHNYSEAIYHLLVDGRTNAAEVLLRPIFETFITHAYIFNTKSFINLKRFIADDEIELKELGEKVKKFLENYPDVKVAKEIQETDWDKFSQDKEKEVKKILGKYYKYVPRLPDLRGMAQEIDKEIQKKKRKPLSHRVEWSYLTMYWYFSAVNHLGSRGLNTFFDTDANGKHNIRLSGRVDDITKIIPATYGFYFGILKNYAKQFGFYNESFKQYRRVIKDLIK